MTIVGGDFDRISGPGQTQENTVSNILSMVQLMEECHIFNVTWQMYHELFCGKKPSKHTKMRKRTLLNNLGNF